MSGAKAAVERRRRAGTCLPKGVREADSKLGAHMGLCTSNGHPYGHQVRHVLREAEERLNCSRAVSGRLLQRA